MTAETFAQGLVGVTLDGRYRLDSLLGEGGMGSVFRATHLAMDRKVAVKLLKPHLTSDQAALDRFAREARATLKVDSPHAVKILDFGVTPLADYYMVLEYLDGRTVQRELEIDGPFAPARVAHIARHALHALGAAHGHGLIHRDVKPDNLLLMRVGSDGDYTKVLDFGVAKLMQGTAGDPASLALTAAGMVFGTPEFMSPEQALGQPLDGRSDLYSLAATMFAMLTGCGLFEGDTAIEWLTHHALTPAPQLAMVRPELAAFPELDALLQRCLAKHRDQRPATAGEMAGLLAALDPTLTRSPASAPPRIAGTPTPSHASSFVQALRPVDPASSSAALAFAPTGALPGVPAVGVAAPADRGPVVRARPAAARAGDLRDRGPAAVPRAGAPAGLAGISVRRPHRARRRLGLWVGGAAVASLIGIAAGALLLGPDPAAKIAEPRRVVELLPSDAGPAELPGDDARVAPAMPADAAEAAAPADAAAIPTPPRSPPSQRPVHAAAAARNPELDEYLRAAEEAFQTHNLLRQIAQANLALQADPHSVRARYLIGDALLKSGDIDHGCQYLAPLKHLTIARERAAAAGCSRN